MKNASIIIGFAVVAFLISLFPTWNFSKRVTFPASSNPLWTALNLPVDSPLTHDLRNAGFTFHTGRGAETENGICFGDFDSDEYWVIQYRSDDEEIDAYALIIGINWLGHLYSYLRFSDLKETLETYLNPAEQGASATP